MPEEEDDQIVLEAADGQNQVLLELIEERDVEKNQEIEQVEAIDEESKEVEIPIVQEIAEASPQQVIKETPKDTNESSSKKRAS
jgi:hypothetical protein